MTGRRRCLLAGLVLLLPGTLPLAAGAEVPTTRAAQAVILLYPTMRPLMSKQADSAMAPSSMAKLMTAYMVFEALEQGRISEETRIRVSRRAADVVGAKLGLRAGDRVPAGVLVEAMIVHSANDAAIALAEHLADSEDGFARDMTTLAATLGLKNSRFRNATGHTAPGQQTTAREVAILSGLLLIRFPGRYETFSRRSVSFRGKTYRNRNPLLGKLAGVDGLKTGQTRAGGYGIAVSAERGGVRLFLVINGLASERERAAEAERLLVWGFEAATRSPGAPPRR